MLKRVHDFGVNSMAEGHYFLIDWHRLEPGNKDSRPSTYDR